MHNITTFQIVDKLCVCAPQTLEDVFLKLSQQQDLQLSKEAAKGASIVSNEFAYHVDLIVKCSQTC